MPSKLFSCLDALFSCYIIPFSSFRESVATSETIWNISPSAAVSMVSLLAAFVSQQTIKIWLAFRLLEVLILTNSAPASLTCPGPTLQRIWDIFFWLWEGCFFFCCINHVISHHLLLSPPTHPTAVWTRLQRQQWMLLLRKFWLLLFISKSESCRFSIYFSEVDTGKYLDSQK